MQKAIADAYARGFLGKNIFGSGKNFDVYWHGGAGAYEVGEESALMSIELMLNGVNLSFVAFAAHWHALSGQIFVFFVMVVAAAEAAVGLAIIIAVYRTRETLNVDKVNLLKL